MEQYYVTFLFVSNVERMDIKRNVQNPRVDAIVKNRVDPKTGLP